MYFYLHIPKTGGQTLASRLAGAFPVDRTRILRDEFKPDGPVRLQDLAANHDFVEGHIAGGALLSVDGLRILTSVRHPVDQIVSHYRHVRREPLHPLHGPANGLSVRAFFEGYGASFTNHQAAYLVDPFFAPSVGIYTRPRRLLFERLYAALDRIEWLVPTESIDEFTLLWGLEAGLSVPYASFSRNIAESTGEADGLREYVRSRQDLYDVDLCLWNEACLRYARYRRRLLQTKGASQARAFADGEAGVWLFDGWHVPERRLDGVVEWWSGPGRVSHVEVARDGRFDFLTFEIPCFCGISHKQVVVVDAEDRRLPSAITAGPGAVFEGVVDLRGLPDVVELRFVVPFTASPWQVTRTSEVKRLQAFAAQNWRLTATDPRGHA